MKPIFQKITSYKYMAILSGFIPAHKILSSIIVMATVFLAYWGISVLNDNSAEIRYVLAAVERGNLVVSVTGSGQVSASNQIEIKPKVSGDVVYVGVKSGEEVAAGALIAQLNTRDAQKAVRDAEANLESAKIALAKLKKPADTLSLVQAENSAAQAEENLKKDYDEAFDNIANTFLDLPAIVSGLQDVLYGKSVMSGQDNIAAYTDMVKSYNNSAVNIKNDTVNKHIAARNSYDKTFALYKIATRSSDIAAIENLASESYEAVKKVADAVKSASNLLGLVKKELSERNLNIPAGLTTHQSSLADYTTKINSHLSSLSDSISAIENNKRAVAEKTEALVDVKKGADDLDLSAQELAVKQKENALEDAREKLADYYIRAPLAGAIAKLDIKKPDNVSVNDIVAIIITPQKFAEIALNEVDVAQIKIGQKVKLTFDAVEDLRLVGEVAELDLIGVMEQGVVTYNVKIAFDAADERIKPGMSVSADIVTEVKENILLVPNGAIKTENRRRYVELPAKPAIGSASPRGVVLAESPRRIDVQTGVSNDRFIEIVSGLSEGDQIIVRTISPQNTTATQQAPSLFGQPRGVGGGTRIPH